MQTFSDYERLYRRVKNEGNPDQSKTLKSFQKRAAIVRGAVRKLMEKRDEDLAKLEKIYTPTAMQECRRPLDREFNGVVQLALNELNADLEKCLAAKRDALDRANSAPTEEQLRLLQTLNMRTSLTSAELNAVAEKLNTCIPALRLLGDLAASHGLDFPKRLADPELIESNLDLAEEACRDMINAVAKPQDALSYKERCFYDYAGTQTWFDATVAGIDSNLFTAAQALSIEKTPLTKANAVCVMLSGSESLASLSDQFGVSSDKIRAANPNYDFSEMKKGDSLIVPSGKMKMWDGPGFVTEAQVAPTYLADE